MKDRSNTTPLSATRLRAALRFAPQRNTTQRQQIAAWKDKTDGYDPTDDFARSIDEAYRVIRERIANGGPGWTPKR